MAGEREEVDYTRAAFQFSARNNCPAFFIVISRRNWTANRYEINGAVSLDPGKMPAWPS